jgi:hypothetical protein
MVHGGSQREIAVAQAVAFCQQSRPALEVEALDADMPALAGGLGDDDGIALAHGVFLDDDGIGAGREEAAGEDAGGFAGGDRALERMPGRHLAD